MVSQHSEDWKRRCQDHKGKDCNFFFFYFIYLFLLLLSECLLQCWAHSKNSKKHSLEWKINCKKSQSVCYYTPFLTVFMPDHKIMFLSQPQSHTKMESSTSGKHLLAVFFFSTLEIMCLNWHLLFFFYLSANK